MGSSLTFFHGENCVEEKKTILRPSFQIIRWEKFIIAFFMKILDIKILVYLLEYDSK